MSSFIGTDSCLAGPGGKKAIVIGSEELVVTGRPGDILPPNVEGRKPHRRKQRERQRREQRQYHRRKHRAELLSSLPSPLSI